MCCIKDLIVMVVEPDTQELRKTCNSLEKLGVTRIICVCTYKEALDSIEQDPNIDIVLADFDIEGTQNLGLMLGSMVRENHPDILFVLTSKKYSGSLFLSSMLVGAVDVLDKNREDEIENLMVKWVALAQLRNETRELFNGIRKTENSKRDC